MNFNRTLNCTGNCTDNNEQIKYLCFYTVSFRDGLYKLISFPVCLYEF